MRYEWNASKSEQNLQRRGFDFEFATLVFENRYVEFADTRKPYGEHRLVAIGVADGHLLTVVFTDRRDSEGDLVRRVISARLSNRKERRRHGEELEARKREGPEPGPG